MESVVRPLSTFKLYLRAVFLLKRLSLLLSPPMWKHTHSWLVYLSEHYLYPLSLPSDWVTDGKWWQIWQVQTRSWTPAWQKNSRGPKYELFRNTAGVHFIASHRCSMSGCDSSCGLLLRKMAFCRLWNCFFFSFFFFKSNPHWQLLSFLYCHSGCFRCCQLTFAFVFDLKMVLNRVQTLLDKQFFFFLIVWDL